MKIRENVDLRPYNTFGISANARHFVEIESLDDLKEIRLLPFFRNFPCLILGEGSNILFLRDYEGVVLKISVRGVREVGQKGNEIWVEAMGGEKWRDLVKHTVEKGYGGLENLSAIPGTVGAALVQNIGAYGVEVKDVVLFADAFSLETGEEKRFLASECGFGYRDSIFKTSLKGKYAIGAATFCLDARAVPNLSYPEIRRAVCARPPDSHLGCLEMAQIITDIRQKKLPDPKYFGNAGSFFKNPSISEKECEKLKKKYPELPAYLLPDGSFKVPAGWLIERSGWKGKSFGNAAVSDKHSLVLVNRGNARGPEILHLAQKIKKDIFNRFGIMLQEEVEIV